MRMQKLARQPVYLRAGVVSVAGDGMTGSREMDRDLVRPARL